eukprot:1306221-Prymnesium_polylepis.1
MCVTRCCGIARRGSSAASTGRQYSRCCPKRSRRPPPPPRTACADQKRHSRAREVGSAGGACACRPTK